MSSKLREALNEILEIASPISTGDDDDPVERIAQIAEAALAEPLRNCEVGTAEELSERFSEFCTPLKCAECPLNKSATTSGDCGVRWSQMPYESEVKNG